MTEESREAERSRPRFGFDPSLNFRMIARLLGIFLTIFSTMMLIPPFVQLAMGDKIVGPGHANAFLGFGLSAAAGGLLGLLLLFLGRTSPKEFFRREGLLSVALIWFLLAFLGDVPFYLTGVTGDLIDGFFEASSGLTTTGSSIFGGGDNWPVDQLPDAILFWRALLHWIGGVGIVVMFLVFLPALGISKKTLFQAEVVGLSKEGIKPRVKDSARALVKIYIILTAMITLSYWVLGMGPFDAICHAFATIATGGFSTKDGSIAEYQSIGIEIVVILGMFLSGVNFGLYYEVGSRMRRRMGTRRIPGIKDLPRLRDLKEIFWEDPEWRFYTSILLLAILLITLSLWLQVGTVVPSAGFDVRHDYSTVGASLRDAAFQTTNLVSSTGFANSNLNGFSFFSQVLLLMIMISGACSGSTSGGFKMVRVLIVFKSLGHSMRRFIRPRSMEPVLLEGRRLELGMLEAVAAMFMLWILVLAFATLGILVLQPDLDPLSGFSSVVACLSNMGPGMTQLIPGSIDAAHALGTPANGLGIDVSSYGSYGAYNDPTKILLSFVMIFGRLEIYTPLIIFLPSFWSD